jgi:Protein of unknown function (DUF4013)
MSTQNPYVPPSGSSSPPPVRRPPPAPPADGPSLDFGRALGFFFQDPNWVSKLLMGSLFTILSVFLVGGIFIAGYTVRLVRRAARGEPYPLPEWDDLGGMFMEGLSAIGAYLAHLVPVVVAVLVLIVPVAILGSRNGDSSPAAAILLIPLGLIAGLLFLGLVVYFPAAFTRMAVEGRFGAAFEVLENWSFLRRNAMNYLLAIVLLIVANFISQFGILLFCIGIIPATFWSYCVFGYALGEVAFRDPNRSVARST